MFNVVCFPLQRRYQLIEETRRFIKLQPAEGAARFWRMTIRRMRVELATYGIPDHEVARQLEAFAHAVQRPPHVPDFGQGDDAA